MSWASAVWAKGASLKLLSPPKLKQVQAIATRSDKTARNFLAGIHLAAAAIWLNQRHALIISFAWIESPRSTLFCISCSVTMCVRLLLEPVACWLDRQLCLDGSERMRDRNLAQCSRMSMRACAIGLSLLDDTPKIPDVIGILR
jgi:hypothetical protein